MQPSRHLARLGRRKLGANCTVYVLVWKGPNIERTVHDLGWNRSSRVSTAPEKYIRSPTRKIISQENDFDSDGLANEPSRPHDHQKLHLACAFLFCKAARVDVRPKHTMHGGRLRRRRRIVCIFLRGGDERSIGDRRSLSFASSHGEQALAEEFLRESTDLFPPPLRDRLPGTKRSRWFRV